MRVIGKFFIVGGFATAIDLIVFTALLSLSVHYVGAIVAGYAVGFLFHFFASRKFVFKKGVKVATVKKELSFLIFINGVGLFLNLGIVWILSELFLLSVFISRFVAILVVFFWGFFARNIFVYY